VRRAMAVVGSDGREMGKVAAVEVDPGSQAVEYIVLGRLCPLLSYRLAPASLVAGVDGEIVQLQIPGRDVEGLPPRAGDAPYAQPTQGEVQMNAQMTVKAESREARVSPRIWFQIGAIAIAASIAAVLLVQALAIARWPEIALFKPLESYARSALFVLVPGAAATALFAWLAARVQRPVATFVGIAAMVLLVSIIPDYVLPVPHKTFLASSVTAFLHVAAGVITAGVLVLGYRRAAQ
jgi:hypothetical protein